MWSHAATFASRVACRSRMASTARSAPVRRCLSRGLCSESDDAAALLNSEREAMEYDVVVVGAGPAGLAAAIRLKQLEAVEGREISVCVVEKAAEVGAHILSGNVFEPRALDELIPEWRELGVLGDDPTEVTSDAIAWLSNETGSIHVPSFLLPETLHNHGNYVISLSKLVRWLGEHAEELGVEIYPGFPAGEVLYDESGAVVGVATADMGIGKDEQPKDTFMRGMELRAKQTLFAEGARGSCSETVIDRFGLREGKDMQSYGLGIKEVWEVPDEVHQPGLVQHTFGWPLDSSTYGGSFLYHMKPNKVLIGMVVGLDYANPYLSPYEEFQRFKHHPVVSKHLKGGECIAYGARVLNEGGLQAIPRVKPWRDRRQHTLCRPLSQLTSLHMPPQQAYISGWRAHRVLRGLSEQRKDQRQPYCLEERRRRGRVRIRGSQAGGRRR